MKKLLWTIGMAVLALSSCVNEVAIIPDGPDSPRTVVFSETVGTYADPTRAMAGHPIENRPDAGENKGLIPAGKSFGVYAWKHYTEGTTPKFAAYDNALTGLWNRSVTRGGTDAAPTHTYTNPAEWPLAPAELSFLAYYPHTGSDEVTKNSIALTATPGSKTEGANSWPTLTLDYTVPADGAKHIDLMYAHQSQIDYEFGNPDGTVGLNFHHALARMQFSARVRDFKATDKIVITGITLQGAERHSTLTVKDGKAEWAAPDNTGTENDIVVSQIDPTNKELTAEMQLVIPSGGDLLVIPQPTTGLSLKVAVTVTRGSEKKNLEYIVKLSGAPNLRMNEIYNYGLIITPDNASFEVIVRPWGPGGESDYIFEGQHYLRVNKSLFEFNLFPNPEAVELEQLLEVETNYPNSGLEPNPDGWTIENIVYSSYDDWLNEVKRKSDGSGVDLSLTEKYYALPNLTTSRVTFDVVAGNLRKEIEVRLRSVGVHAAPGQIGIKMSDYLALLRGEKTLGDGTYSPTIRGSVIYKDTWVETAGLAEIGQPLEEEYVYAVYYKWGSLVAMIGGEQGDPWNTDGSEVVWVNPEFTGSVAGPYNTNTPFSPALQGATGTGNNIKVDLPLGHGDPCMFVNGGTAAAPSGWMTPTGNPWNNRSDYCLTTLPEETIEFLPPYSGGVIGRRDIAKTIFFPYAGYRFIPEKPTLSDSYGSLETLFGKYAFYWSSTAMNANSGYILNLRGDAKDIFVQHSDNGKKDHGGTVRCVKALELTLSEVEAFDYHTDDPKTVTVATNADSWKITEKESWITVSKTTGSRGENFTVVPDSNYPGHDGELFRTGTVTVTAGGISKSVTVKQYALWGGHGDILYFDTQNRLAIGAWGDGRVTLSNMVFTQFGSVIGFTNGGVAWNNTGSIRFDPTNKTGGYNYAAIPNFTGHGNGSTSVSSPEYHNEEHLAQGRGDICKLIGLTAADARQLIAEERLAGYTGNDGWRLPTARENASFVGGGSASDYTDCYWIDWKTGSPPYDYAPVTTPMNRSDAWPFYYDTQTNTPVANNADASVANPRTGRFPVVTDVFNGEYSQKLPAAGHRNPGGVANNAGIYGGYWSSTAGGTQSGYHIFFYQSRLYTVENSDSAIGHAIRCVRDDQSPRWLDEHTNP